ncbi:MAG: hypothetical protein AAGG01_11600 [Planctomycetota bacterium]
MSPCAATTDIPEGTVIGGGGDGAPGLIQLHVQDPDTQLAFGASGTTSYVTAGIDLTRSMAPPPVGWTTPQDTPGTLVPFFGSKSASFSRWIPLGLARLNPDGSANPVEFAFEGTDADGRVQRNGESAAELAPLLPYSVASIGSSGLSIQTSTATLNVPGSALADPNGLYAENASLLREFAVRVRDSSTPAEEEEFAVVAAVYEAGADEYRIALDPNGTRLGDVIADLNARPGDLEVEVVPFFFRLLTAGTQDLFPAGTDVRITFDATINDPLGGGPSTDPEVAFSGRVAVGAASLDERNGFTGMIEALNGPVAAPGQTDVMNLQLEQVTWDVFRFRVEFDLGTTLTQPGVELPGIDFLRIPYRF